MELHGKEKFTQALTGRIALRQHGKPADELTDKQREAAAAAAAQTLELLVAERCSVIWADKDGTSHVIQ